MTTVRRSGEPAVRPVDAPPLRILLADDHPVVRAGVRGVIEEEEGMRVVGEAGDGVAACELVAALRPDVLVIDFAMPKLNGALATTEALRQLPSLRVVALTVHDDPAHLNRFLAAGASGYVLKRSASGELLRAIQVVASGGLYIDPALTSHVVDGYLGKADAATPGTSALSARELEVLRLTAMGHGNKGIAAQLGVSVRTVETYRARVMTKLALRSREALVQFAVRNGLLG